MEFINVIAAAAASFAFGAVWYSALSGPWIEASGVETGADGKPANASNPAPYIIAFLAAVLVAGMLRHVLISSGVDSVAKGMLTGLGVGLFLVTPWLATCYSFGGRPGKLILIDGGYASFGCAIMGAVLTLF